MHGLKRPSTRLACPQTPGPNTHRQTDEDRQTDRQTDINVHGIVADQSAGLGNHVNALDVASPRRCSALAAADVWNVSIPDVQDAMSEQRKWFKSNHSITGSWFLFQKLQEPRGRKLIHRDLESI